MNSNYNEKVSINTDTLTWESTENLNVFEKLLSSKNNQKTSLIKIEKDGNLKENATINSVEIFVIKGTYINEFGKFTQGSFLRFPQENERYVESITGCIILKKSNYFTDKNEIIISTESTVWQEGQGNLKVMPLYDQTALVRWPKNEKFVQHSHWGGEEIFVIKGCFMDEHEKYQKGSWLRSPHLSTHLPYVKEETVILVKTGHVWEDDAV